MISDGTYTAVLDRFEVTQNDDELAVLLVEADGEVVDELVVERERLSATGRQVDAVFEVAVEGGDLLRAEFRPEATEDRGEAAQSRFDRLAGRPPDDDKNSTE